MEALAAVDAQELRAIQRDNMPHRCVINGTIEVMGPGGRPTITDVVVYDGACRLAPLGEIKLELVIAGALTAPDRYRVILPAGTPVARDHYMVVTGTTETDDGPLAWSKTLDVEGIEPADTAIEITRKVIGKVRP